MKVAVKQNRPRRFQSWMAYTLWVVALLGPSVCVVWLVRKTVENEKVSARQFAREAISLRLEKAEETLFRNLDTAIETAVDAVRNKGSLRGLTVLEDGAAEAVAIWEDGEQDFPAGDTEAARALLGEARKAFADTAEGSASGIALTLLSREDVVSQRFGDGRNVSAMVAEMAVKRSDRVSPELAERIDQLVLAEGENALTAGQFSRLLDVYAASSSNAKVGALVRNRDQVVRWLGESGQDGVHPPTERFLVTENCVAIVDTEGGVALLYDRSSFAQRWTGTLGDDVSLYANANDLEAESDGSVRGVRRRLPAPLDWLSLKPGPLLLADAMAPDADRTAVYFWIGGIVLGLSLISGFAIVLFVRSQTSSAQLKNDLVATVTHELKTPVASIRLLIDTLRDKRREGFVNRDEYLELIDRENRRLGHLIDNFLSFSRLERNKNRFAMEPIDPRLIVSEAETAFRDRFQDRAYTLDTRIEEGVPLIRGDKEALWTAVGNLLENALKYGGPQGRIVFSLRKAAGGAEFSVQDFGKGISRREQKRIFRRFYQVDRNHAEHSGSVGLGLSIVEFIVSSHRGTVEVDSIVGAGSIFRITIPYA